MALPNTDTITPLFLAEHPDWQRGVALTLTAKTDVQTQHAGSEQRARWRNLPRLGLEYVVAALNTQQAAVRRVRAAYECQSPLICPVWPWGEAIEDFDELQVSTVETFVGKFWQAGQPILIEDGDGTQIFRTIDTIDPEAKLITLLGDIIAITDLPNAKVYPCFFGVRVRAQGLIEEHGLTADETFRLEQL